jgi:hypothetical protein
MENKELHIAVYNIEQENIAKEEEERDGVKNKLENKLIEDFLNQQKADDSILDDTPFDVENDNMQILLDAA